MNKDYFRALLRAKLYKATPARLNILAVLAAAKKPLRVQEILTALGKERADQATVYRTVLALKETGLVKQIDFQQGATYYELVSTDEHHHVVCVKCERVADVRDCCRASMETAALVQSGFAEIKQHSLEFFGLCKACKVST